MINILHKRGYRVIGPNNAIILWSKNDVLTVAKQEKIKLNENQITEILETIEMDHDANVGVTWDTVREVVWDTDNKN